MHSVSHLVRRQWWLLGILGVWAFFGSFWYTCHIKYLCKNKVEPVAVAVTKQTPGVPAVLGAEVTSEVNGTPASELFTQTPSATWDALVSNPVLVYFGMNNDNVITENVEPVLKNIVAYLAENPTQKIVVTGHTNAHRNNAFAQSLGLERAKKVKELLVSYGAPAQSIEVTSRGDQQLAAPATTPENQALNRRAVISVVREALDAKY